MPNQKSNEILAINGGTPVRATPMPGRRLFDEAALKAVQSVFERAWEKDVDFGFHGEAEERYTQAFTAFQGGGFADAVSSGTAGIYLALKALDIPAGSEVVVPPVTDPGGVTPVVLTGLKPVVADAREGGFNLGVRQIEQVITSRTKALIVAHIGGVPAAMDEIVAVCQQHRLKLIEDCSQAHGAEYHGKKVGTFGDVAVFSTMFTKAHASGGCGGLVYVKDETLYWRVLSFADRGKNFLDADFDPRNLSRNLFPALNFNQDELSCAIGLASLQKLPHILARRNEIIQSINAGLSASRIVRPVVRDDDITVSPFFHTLTVAADRITVSKEAFARAIMAEGIPLNPDYKQVVSEWTWFRPHLAAASHTPNAVAFRDTSFNILFHENYREQDVADIVNAILKVERVLGRQ